MKGFGIYVKNDLLEPKHYESFGGGALFLYLWLLDKMTSISEEGIGLVLGGKPIKYSEVFQDLPIPVRTYRDYIELLREEGYINTNRTPRGLIFSVNKAVKIFNGRSAEIRTSKSEPKKNSDVQKSVVRSAKKTHAIKTIQRQYNNTSPALPNGRQKCPVLLKEKYPLLKKYNNNHKECTEYIDDISSSKGHKFINYAAQIGHLHKILRAGFDFPDMDKVINRIEKETFYQEKGWDFATVAKNLERR